MQDLLLFTYTIVFFLYALVFCLRLLGWRRTEWCVGVIALIANAAVVTLIIVFSGHAPVFGLFESLLLATLVLGALGFFCAQPEDRLPDVRMCVWMEILVLLGITLFFTKEPSPDVYDRDYLCVVLFFGFRKVALAVTLFSTAQFVRFRVVQKSGSPGNDLLRKGRNFLLLGAILFLASEYAGIIWCQNGWGDFWHWSAGFFQSDLVVLYLMLAFHLPGKNRRSERIRSLIGGMSGFVMLSLIIIRSIY